MKDEYNSEFYKKISEYGDNALPQETKSFCGNPDAQETKSFCGNADAQEFSYGAGKASGAKASEKKSASKIAGIVKGFLAVSAVTAVFAVAAVSYSGNVNAEFLSLAATDEAVSYTVNVEGDKQSELVLYNDFTRREVTLSSGENTGEISGLKPNMKYTVAVVYQSAVGEMTVVKDSVRTEEKRAAAAPVPVSAFYSVSHECTCNVDGYFHFTLDFIDENGYWSDFKATLEDAYGTVSTCNFTEDLHGEQSIDVVLEARLSGNTARFTLSFKMDSPEHCPNTDLFDYDESTQTCTYSVEVKI